LLLKYTPALTLCKLVCFATYPTTGSEKTFTLATPFTLMTDLTAEQSQSVKKSYLNIVALFLSDQKLESRYLRCLLKWGFQLHISPDDLKKADIDLTNLSFSNPADKMDKLEALYHLVYMIYLDKVVEDIELEVATIYAKKLGFDSAVVSELFKSIATADSDAFNFRDVRQEVMDFMKLHENR
jgi:hypothetical protein